MRFSCPGSWAQLSRAIRVLLPTFDKARVMRSQASSPSVIGYLKFRIRLEMREGTERTGQLAV